MWAAVLIAVVASAGNNIGKVLQKQATDSLPRLSLDNKVLKAYLRSALWLTGLLVDLLGAVLMLEAVAHAPVSVVQPVSGCGMAVMAVFSHAYLKEPMTSRDWLGVTLAATGTLGVGFCSDRPKVEIAQQKEGNQQISEQQGQEQQSAQHQQASQQMQRLQSPEQPQISPAGLLVFLALLGIFLLSSETWLASRTKAKRRHNPREAPLLTGNKSEVADEVVAGCQAGCCFGLSAATVKTGFLLSSAASVLNGQRQKLLAASAVAVTGTGTAVAASSSAAGRGAAAVVAAASQSTWVARGGALWGLAGIGAGISLSSAGFFCQTRGFKEGRAVVVSTCAAVSSILTAVIGGMVALGETLPVEPTLRAVLFSSWLLILAGICLLVGDKTISPTFDTLRPSPLRPAYGPRKLPSNSRYTTQSLSPPSNLRKHES